MDYHDLQGADGGIALDQEGFLRDVNDWSPEVAGLLAAQDALRLEDAHWEIIELFRHYYQAHGLIPILRVLGRVIERELGGAKANSQYLHRLFPMGPLRQASRIAGLPKPPSCL